MIEHKIPASHAYGISFIKFEAGIGENDNPFFQALADPFAGGAKLQKYLH